MPIFSDPERFLSLSNTALIVAAMLTVAATLAVVYFGDKVTAVKQQQLKAYQADADARIAEADAKAAEAHSGAGVANQRAEEAKTATARIEHDNLLLQQQLDQERDARLAIEKKVSQRGLTMAEIGDALRIIHPLGPQPIDIVFYRDDAEVRMLANNLTHLFSGWKITLVEAPGGTMHQVNVEYDPKDPKATECAQAIFAALNGAGKLRVGGPFAALPADVEGSYPGYYQAPPTATIRITVGYR
jgi:hypothetical protein